MGLSYENVTMKSNILGATPYSSTSADTKRAGYEQMMKVEAERKVSTANKYGVWGNNFKTRENFVSLHFC